MAKLSIYKYVRTDKGWRYCKAAFHPNGKIKPNVVVVSGVEEKHTEGRYFLNFNNQWIDVGEDALGAQRKRLLRLNQIEYERLSGRRPLPRPAGHPSVVGFSGRKVIKDEVEAYLADLELTRRPARTVQSKRKYLGDFVGLIGKKFADEYRREDVLKYKNKLQDKGFEPKTIDTRMMAVVTFFNLSFAKIQNAFEMNSMRTVCNIVTGRDLWPSRVLANDSRHRCWTPVGNRGHLRPLLLDSG